MTARAYVNLPEGSGCQPAGRLARLRGAGDGVFQPMAGRSMCWKAIGKP